jgi:hypothetical protein
MKTYGKVEIQLLRSRLRHLMEVSCQLHTTAALPPGKQRLVPIGKAVMWAPRQGLDAED